MSNWISGTPISAWPDLVTALACIKEAAAETNHQLGLLDAARRDAIVTACPLCRYNLSKYSADVPVVYFTELLAQALGVEEEA